VCVCTIASLAACGGSRSEIAFNAKVIPADETNAKVPGDPNGHFGVTVSLSGDGMTALVGGNQDQSGSGAAWLFVTSASGWRQDGPKWRAPDEFGVGGFGSSVSLAEDGNTALIGAPETDSSSGAAWVFTRSGGVWRPEARLGEVRGRSSGSRLFGWSTALSANGKIAFVGAPAYRDRVGAAFLFRRTSRGWRQMGGPVLGARTVGIPGFGSSVALSADGSTGAVGGPEDGGGRANRQSGAVWLFTVSSEGWKPLGAKLVPGANNDSLEGSFGCSVALSAHGDRLVVGACTARRGEGAAWIFSRHGASSSRASMLTAPFDLNRDGKYGYAVSISGDGRTAVVSEPYAYNARGAVAVYEDAGSSWRPVRRLHGLDGAKLFGYSVAVSDDGTRVIVGAPGVRNGAGAAWLRSL
jgi:hypothetical protein